MQTLMLYFSGTGNTAYLCQRLAQGLREAGQEVDISSIEDLAPDQLPAHDLLVLGFPVYGLEAPTLVQDYVTQMPLVQRRGALVLTTQGGLSGGAPRRALERLMARGYTPLGHATINMPFSDGMLVMSKRNPYVRWVTRRDFSHLTKLERLQRRILEVANALAQGAPLVTLRRPLPLGLPLSLAGRPLRRLMDALNRRAARRLWADERCTRCGTCARLCPMSNITVDELGPHFGEQCVLCVRCISQCPVEAIQLGEMTRDKARWRGPGGSYRP